MNQKSAKIIQKFDEKFYWDRFIGRIIQAWKDVISGKNPILASRHLGEAPIKVLIKTLEDRQELVLGFGNRHFFGSYALTFAGWQIVWPIQVSSVVPHLTYPMGLVLPAWVSTALVVSATAFILYSSYRYYQTSQEITHWKDLLLRD